MEDDPSSAPEPGGETQAYCTTCKVMNEHIIVAVVGTKPARVECQSCHKQHNYRARPPGASRPRTSRASATAAPPPPTIDLQAAIGGRGGEPYDANRRFNAGEVVRHPTFGTGLVTLLPGPRKMEVLFNAGTKLLAHDRAAATAAPGLVRPPPRVQETPSRATDAPEKKL